ncbi:hypothetical protein [Bradyrhizobium arachidis]|uniref:Uncharacterized protein n=1 Tax=Bradyrhizobium arachidis TaxID=858423 RepID=A0AAE7NMD2_9BRAD|nr:hypothetical protein [Bradyrhizobium arachidis]QOZ68593.1 hypothetical protein WN72_21405 [Bradyrhizobium arachidis]SFV06558.1 hypothetical protein SAMN05192541_112164 [Bradyrhizobium arachidis]
MTSLRQQIGQTGLAAPKSTAWQIAFVIAGLPIIFFVIGPTLLAWLSGRSTDLFTTAGGLAALVLILLPTWIALFLNQRHVLLICLSNLVCVLIGVLGAADMPVFSWIGLGSEAWWSVLGWQFALIWSFINSNRPAAAERDPSAPPVPSLTTISP